MGVRPAGASGSVTPIARAKDRRWLPWSVAATTSMLAVAAIILLYMRTARPLRLSPAVAEVPPTWTSRPADAVIGPIARERAGDASARIDYIFADRLDGYRERRLSRGGRR